jgi:hypothetical protein
LVPDTLQRAPFLSAKRDQKLRRRVRSCRGRGSYGQKASARLFSRWRGWCRSRGDRMRDCDWLIRCDGQVMRGGRSPRGRLRWERSSRGCLTHAIGIRCNRQRRLKTFRPCLPPHAIRGSKPGKSAHRFTATAQVFTGKSFMITLAGADT